MILQSFIKGKIEQEGILQNHASPSSLEEKGIKEGKVDKQLDLFWP